MKKIDHNLIERFQNGTASEAEKAEVLKWYREMAEQGSEFPEDEQVVEDQMLERLMVATGKAQKRLRPYYWVAAASIAAVLCMGAYYFAGDMFGGSNNNHVANFKVHRNKGSVILTLADGSKVDLNRQGNFELPLQAGIKLQLTSAGELQYSYAPLAPGGQKAHSTDTVKRYNTIRTPSGERMVVVLSDGTKVWLNARSVLKFPVDLSIGKERLVSLVGEGYFEVHRNKKHPFRVSSKDQVVEVLGTHFNVKAYPEEAISKTTLLEGAVRVASKGRQVKLRPGQEALLKEKLAVLAVNTANAVAWKDGHFKFEDERLETIMNAISRWYDVKVVYETEDLKNEKLGVLSDHTDDVATLLNIMAQTGDIKFKVIGETVYVTKQ